MWLAAEDLGCIRGGRSLFSGLSFSLQPGNAIVVTGPNGAGKTSLLRMIAGLLTPASGRIAFSDSTEAVGEHCHFIGHFDAAKGALTVYCQGLRSRLYESNVSVTTIKLGPVDTPMTKDHPKNLLFGKPASVAKDIMHAIDAGTPEAFVPFYWAAIMPVVKNTPEALFQKLSFLSGR